MKPLEAKNMYYISDLTLTWIQAVGITTEQQLLSTSAEDIYIAIKQARSEGILEIKVLSKCMLYALRSAQHHLETGEKIPYQVFKKPSDKDL